jgi:glycine hydroxymethyltransferase
MNQVAATAVALKLAAEASFKTYAQQVLKNAKALAAALSDQGAYLVTGGTDNHLMVIDVVKSFSINGSEAEKALDHAGITTNKQVIPDDPNPPLKPSGVRLGTPAATTRGMKEGEMKALARVMVEAMKNHGDARRLEALRQETRVLCSRFPVPGL